jgi:hypothetical protein
MRIPTQASSPEAEAEPIDIEQIRYGATLRLASFFRVLALLTVAGGALCALAIAFSNTSHSDRATAAIAVFFGCMISAAFIAFFGHVLEVLVGIYGEVWQARLPEDD